MMRKFDQVVRLEEFKRDIKKLSKRYRTLEEDLNNFINTGLYVYHKLNIEYSGIVRISNLGIETPVYKATKFSCRSLKGRGAQSGIRVIYTYKKETDTIELIEIYHKSDKDLQDNKRIFEHYRN